MNLDICGNIFNKYREKLFTKTSTDPNDFSNDFKSILSYAFNLSKESPNYEQSFKLVFKMFELSELITKPLKRKREEVHILHYAFSNIYHFEIDSLKFLRSTVMKMLETVMNSIEYKNLILVCYCSVMLNTAIEEGLQIETDNYSKIFKKRISIYCIKIVYTLREFRGDNFLTGLKFLLKFISKGVKFKYFEDEIEFRGNLTELLEQIVDILNLSDLSKVECVILNYVFEILNESNNRLTNNTKLFYAVIKLMENENETEFQGIIEKGVRVLNSERISISSEFIDLEYHKSKGTSSVQDFYDYAIDTILKYGLSNSISFKLIVKFSTRIPACTHSSAVIESIFKYIEQKNLLLEAKNKDKTQRKRIISFIQKRLTQTEIITKFFMKFETLIIPLLGMLKEDSNILKLLVHISDSFIVNKTLILKYKYGRVLMSSFNDSMDYDDFVNVVLKFKTLKDFQLNADDFRNVFNVILLDYRDQFIKQMRQAAIEDSEILFHRKFQMISNLYKHITGKEFLAERMFLGLRVELEKDEIYSALELLMKDNIDLYPIVKDRIQSIEKLGMITAMWDEITTSEMNETQSDLKKRLLELYIRSYKINTKLYTPSFQVEWNLKESGEIIEIKLGSTDSVTIDKNVLAESSVAFEAMLYGSFLESRNTELHLKEDPIVLQMLVEYFNILKLKKLIEIKEIFILLMKYYLPFEKGDLEFLIFSLLIPWLKFSDKYLMRDFKRIGLYGLIVVLEDPELSLLQESNYRTIKILFFEVIELSPDEDFVRDIIARIRLVLLRIVVSLAYKCPSEVRIGDYLELRKQDLDILFID